MFFNLQLGQVKKIHYMIIHHAQASGQVKTKKKRIK